MARPGSTLAGDVTASAGAFDRDIAMHILDVFGVARD
jgi:hypothetical protein